MCTILQCWGSDKWVPVCSGPRQSFGFKWLSRGFFPKEQLDPIQSWCPKYWWASPTDIPFSSWYLISINRFHLTKMVMWKWTTQSLWVTQTVQYFDEDDCLYYYKSGLVPLIEGLRAQILFLRFEIIRGLLPHLLLFFIERKDMLKKKNS